MWLDIMSQYNTLQVNIKLANLLGLEVATYWAALMDVYARVVNKFKDELEANSGYFELDRNYITKRTTLTLDKQLEIDTGLGKLGVLKHRSENELNWITLDVEKLCAILVDDSIDAIRDIQRVSKLRREDTTRAKKAAVRINLVAALKETDPDVLTAYNNWIDALLEAKKPITRQALDIYQNNLNNYTDNKQAKIKILEIATTNAYTEFAWSMKIYEKDYTGIRSLKDMFAEYVSKVKAVEVMQNRIAELEKNIDALDEDIEELEDAGLDRTVEILCKTRNSLNSERLELEIHVCKLRLWLAEFEKARQLEE